MHSSPHLFTAQDLLNLRGLNLRCVNLRIPNWRLRMLVALLCFNCATTWAYKVEKVCSEAPATAAALAKKTCKIVRVDPSKEPAPKEEKKEEKKKSGH